MQIELVNSCQSTKFDVFCHKIYKLIINFYLIGGHPKMTFIKVKKVLNSCPTPKTFVHYFLDFVYYVSHSWEALFVCVLDGRLAATFCFSLESQEMPSPRQIFS